MLTRYSPRPGPRLGAEPGHSAVVSTANLTANGTSTILIPHPGRKVALHGGRLRIGALATPVTPGTLVAALKKYDKTNAAVVVIASGIDLLALGLAANSPVVVDLPSLSDLVGTLRKTDTLYLEIVSNNATISVQPGQLTVDVDFLFLD